MDELLGHPVVWTNDLARPKGRQVEASWTFDVDQAQIGAFEVGQPGQVALVCDGAPPFTVAVRCSAVDYEGGVVTFELADARAAMVFGSWLGLMGG